VLPVAGEIEYWFWPRLAEAEPDVVLLFGDVLVIVEAKYLSGKSGHGGVDGEDLDPADQLAREWRSCDPMHEACAAYPVALREAIMRGGTKRALIYLVRQPASRRTRRELAASRRAIGDEASLFCLGWSDLAAALQSPPMTSSARWRAALLELLERRGFTAFRGFPFAMGTDINLLRQTPLWQFQGRPQPRITVDLPRSLSRLPMALVRRLVETTEPMAQVPDRVSTKAGFIWDRLVPADRLGALRRFASRGREPDLKWRSVVPRAHLGTILAFATRRLRGEAR
jgi:hypothetical protein